MAVSTLSRDYDLGRIVENFRGRISSIERRLLALSFLLTPGESYDTGQVSLTGDLVGTVSSANFEVSRIGRTVFLQGSITPNTNWGAAMANTNLMATVLDPEFCPTQSHVLIAGSSATGAMVNFRVSLQSGGQIAVRCDTATHTGAVQIFHTYRGTPP